MCGETVFANVSAGADTKANTPGRFECPSSLLERLQRRVALESLGERYGALVFDPVVGETGCEEQSGDGERA